MKILLISANALFLEVIREIISPIQAELMELGCEQAQTRICELKPDVILLDETMAPSCFDSILAEARGLEQARTIVLNPIQNELLLLDSRRATMKKVGDLLDAVSELTEKKGDA